MSLSLRLGTDLIGGAGDSTSSAWFANPTYDDFCAVADFANWRFSLPASGAELSVPASQTILFATGSASGAGFNITATTTSAQIRQNLPSTVVGKLYVCQFKWSGNSSGRNLFGYIGGNSASLGTAASGTATVYITGGNTDGTVSALYASNSVNGDTFYFEMTSVKEVILTRAAGGYGAENLVGASWGAFTGGTSTAVNSPAGTLTITPDGTNSAGFDQSYATNVGQSYLFTFNVATNAAQVRVGTSTGASDIVPVTSMAVGYGQISFKATTTTTYLRFNRAASGVTVITQTSCRAYSATGSYPKQSATFAQFFAYTASSDHARTYVDQSGVYRDMAYNNENMIRNSTMVGAVAGTPGTLPTGGDWVVQSVAGITVNVIGSGTENGLPYLEVQILGTNTSGGTGYGALYFSQGGTNGVPATFGQTWAISGGLKITGGTMSNVNGLGLIWNEFNAAGTYLSTNSPAGSSSVTPSGAITSYAGINPVINATTAFLQPILGYNFLNNASVNITIRIYAPQFERGSAVTTFKPTSGTAYQGGINSPRRDYRNGVSQIRLEDARTNSIINSSGVGSVNGTPGTAPNNWSVTTPVTGLTQTIVGSGIEYGLPYTDIRLNGTANVGGGTYIQIVFSNGAQVTASSGQTWSCSVYARLVGGTTTNIGPVNMNINELNSSFSYVTGGGPSSIALTSTLQRFTYTRTLSGGGTVVYAQPLLNLNPTVAGAVDFTIRVYVPQMELGATVSDPILTTTTAVTRAIETAEFSPVIEALVQNNPAVSFVVRTRLDGATLNNGIANQKIIGGASNHFPLSRNSSSSDQTASYNNASAIVVSGGSNALTSAFGTSIGMDSSGRSITKDQFLIVSDTVAKSTYSLSTLYLNRDAGSVSIGSASYDFLGISPERLSDVALQQYAVAQGTQLSYPITTPAFATGADYWVDLTI